jgi:hypothetical protein
MHSLVSDIGSQPLIESDMSYYAIRYLIQAYLYSVIGGSEITLEAISGIVKHWYSLLLLQIASRIEFKTSALFEISSENLAETLAPAKLIQKAFAVENYEDEIVPRSLTFLRKVTALVVSMAEPDDSQIVETLAHSHMAMEPTEEYEFYMNYLGMGQKVENRIDLASVAILFTDQNAESGLIQMLLPLKIYTTSDPFYKKTFSENEEDEEMSEEVNTSEPAKKKMTNYLS